MAATPFSFSTPGTPLGPPHSGPVRLQQQPPFPSLQHQILRPPSGGHGRDGSELVTREQLHQRPVQVTAADHQEDPTGEVPDHAHRPVVALSTVVSPSSSAGIRLLLRQPTVDHPSVANGKRRTPEESPVETTSLEDLWREHAYDWDLETRTLLEHALRPSTLKSYDSVLVRFKSFCEKCNYPYFPTTNIISSDTPPPFY